jgi:hypothetical protein
LAQREFKVLPGRPAFKVRLDGQVHQALASRVNAVKRVLPAPQVSKGKPVRRAPQALPWPVRAARRDHPARSAHKDQQEQLVNLVPS